MQVREEPEGTLVLSYDGIVPPAILGGCSLLLAILAAWQHVAFGHTNLFGLLATSAACLAGALVLFERTRVVVDPRSRTIVWSRRWAWRLRGGTLGFDEVEAITTERLHVDDEPPGRRLVIRTRAGRTIPLTAAYITDPDDALFAVVDRVRAALEGAAGPRVS